AGSSIPVLRFDRTQNMDVLGTRRACAVALVRRPRAAELNLLVDEAQDPREWRVVGRRDDQPVKVAIERVGLAGRELLLRLVDRRTKRLELGLAALLRREPSREDLQVHAHRVEVGKLRGAERPHERASLRPQLEQPFARELLHRLANRTAAQPEPLGERHLVHALTARERAFEYLRAKPARRLRAERVARDAEALVEQLGSTGSVRPARRLVRDLVHDVAARTRRTTTVQ